LRGFQLDTILTLLLWLVVLTGLSLLGAAWKPDVPKTWDDEALHRLELPIVGLGMPGTHISSDYYYRIPEAPIPKTYPVYAPEHEPAGYMEWLKQQEPAEAVDFSELQTKDDWIEAGRHIFDGPFSPLSARNRQSAEQWREYSGTDLYVRPAKDGTYPWVRYWVVEKGDVRGFFTECGSCHTRVLEDGTVVPGAQGNLNEAFKKSRTSASVGISNDGSEDARGNSAYRGSIPIPPRSTTISPSTKPSRWNSRSRPECEIASAPTIFFPRRSPI